MRVIIQTCGEVVERSVAMVSSLWCQRSDVSSTAVFVLLVALHVVPKTPQQIAVSGSILKH